MEELQNSICPYCKQRLEKVPTRKEKCHYCNNYIYVRTSPLDRKKFITTEKEAGKIDKEWDMFIDSKVGKFSQELLLNLEHKLGRRASLKDAIWAQFQKESQELMVESNKDVNILFDLSMNYYKQALFLKKYGDVSTEYINKIFEISREVKQKYLKMTTLKSFIDSGVVRKVVISPCEDACQKCKESATIVMSLEDVLTIKPLPVRDCEKGWCRCDYAAVYE